MPPSASLTQLPQPPPPPLVSAFAPEKTTPSNNKGSGTPKIGLIKAKHNKYRNSQVASQKCPVHVTHHDYLHENPKMNQWDAYNTPLTMSMLSQYRWCFLQFLCLLHLCFKQLVFLLIFFCICTCFLCSVIISFNLALYSRLVSIVFTFKSELSYY